MCYDVSFTVDIKQLGDYFPDLIFDSQIHINYEATIHIVGHAYGEHSIIYRNREDGLPHIKLMEWGCIPFYVKDLSAFIRQRATMLNARSERILDDPKSYWNKIRNRRCLVPLSGFYEHRAVKGFKNKVPYFITLKNQELFFLPGLYSVSEIVDKETGELIKKWTFTIVTRNANSLMKQIHNDGENKERMPLLLPFDLSLKWLSDDLTDEEYRSILHFEMPSSELNALPVFSIRTSKLRPDGGAKNEFYSWENLPGLILEEETNG